MENKLKLVIIKEDEQLVKLYENEKYDIKYELDNHWISAVLDNYLTWEELFLGCRFTVERSNSNYNDHFLGLLKFANRNALKAVENYEKSMISEFIIVKNNGKNYKIDKFCPLQVLAWKMLQ